MTKTVSLKLEDINHALNVGLVGTWVWDTVSNKIFGNANFAFLLGVEEKNIISSGLPRAKFLSSVNDEDRVRVQEAINQSLLTGDQYEVEYRTVANDKTERWVITRGQVERDADKNAVRLVGVVIDITEQKRAQSALNESQHQLRFMADTMPQMVWIADSNGRVEYYNHQWYDYTGRTSQILQTQDWQDLVHHDDVKECAAAWNKAVKAGTPYEVEYRFRNYNGEYLWVLQRAIPAKDEHENILKWYGTCTEIDAQKRNAQNQAFLSEATKTLASSLDYKKTLQAIVKSSIPNIADWCTVDILDPNNNLQQVALAHKDPAKVKWAREYRKANPVDLSLPTGVGQVIRTGNTEFYPIITDEMLVAGAKSKAELKLMRDIGFSSIIIAPLKLQNKTIGAVSFILAEPKHYYNKHDLVMAEELANRASLAITNADLYENVQAELQVRKRLEEKLRVANEHLEARVQERTKQLEISNQSLGRSNQELQDFAYVASHDLQEPLRKIQAFGNLLEEEYGEQLQDGSHYLERMRSAAARMSSLIEDLLSFSRVSTKTRPAVQVNLNIIVQEVLDDLETRIKETGGSVKISNLPTIKADPMQMRQLFQNLISNALKFHKPDISPNIILSATKEPADDGKIEHSVIRVEDNGIGFDEKYLDRIFSVFQRLHGKESYEGTGIGLAVCRKIVERHGGTITATSKVNKGATFIIKFPLKTSKGIK